MCFCVVIVILFVFIVLQQANIVIIVISLSCCQLWYRVVFCVTIVLLFSRNCDIALTRCVLCHCDIKCYSVYNHSMCYPLVESVILLSGCLLCHCDIKCYCRNASNLICCTGLRHGCTYPAKYINIYLWYVNKKHFFSHTYIQCVFLTGPP